MTEHDLTSIYREKMALLYPDGDGDSPARIEIGTVGRLPQGIVDFGIVKEGGAWIIPEQFASIATLILSREAYLAGFPEKARASKSIQHACTWFAYKDIDDKALKRKFFNQWMVASMQSGSKDVYAQPPVLMQEYDKVIETSPAELHDMLLKFTNENERLLQHQLRIDVAETWGLAKAIESLPTPDPLTIAILHACGKIFVDTAELPKRTDVIDYIAEHPLFMAFTSKKIDKEFALAKKLFYCQYQFDASWIGKKYVHLVFTPSKTFANFDWNTMLSIPGVFIRLNWYQGDLLGDARGKSRSAIAWFLLPSTAVEPFVAFVDTMHMVGMFTAHDVLVGTDILPTVNYNTYVVDATKPCFTIDPIKDEPDLFISNIVEQGRSPADASAFLETLMQNDFKRIRALIDKLNSSFSIKEGRHDSWYQTIAEIAGIHERTATHWLNLLTRERAVLVPEPRSTYYFHASIPVAIRLEFFTRATMSTGERRVLAKAFPATSSVKTRSVNDEDVIIWNVLVPRGKSEAAIDFITSIEPSARVAMHFANLQQAFGTLHSLLHWFDGTGYDQIIPFITTCTATLPRLATADMTTTQFRHACHDPAQVALEAIENSSRNATS